MGHPAGALKEGGTHGPCQWGWMTQGQQAQCQTGQVLTIGKWVCAQAVRASFSITFFHPGCFYFGPSQRQFTAGPWVSSTVSLHHLHKKALLGT